MDAEFWKARWRMGQIGFHEGRPNAFLEAHAGALDGLKRVLVPLCGKAHDLAFLAARGHEVVGVELSLEAAQAFFEERGLSPRVETLSGHQRLSAEGVEILVGDFFETTRAAVGEVDGFYDRAAIIALPPELRGRYVQILRGLFPEGGRGLVITLEYPPGLMQGPPFSVDEAELRAHYEGAELRLLGESSAERRERCFAVRLDRVSAQSESMKPTSSTSPTFGEG